MAWTQADADLIRAAIVDSKGSRVIQLSDGTRVEADLQGRLDLIATIERGVNSARPYHLAVTSKGT